MRTLVWEIGSQAKGSCGEEGDTWKEEERGRKLPKVSLQTLGKPSQEKEKEETENGFGNLEKN